MGVLNSLLLSLQHRPQTKQKGYHFKLCNLSIITLGPLPTALASANPPPHPSVSPCPHHAAVAPPSSALRSPSTPLQPLQSRLLHDPQSPCPNHSAAPAPPAPCPLCFASRLPALDPLRRQTHQWPPSLRQRSGSRILPCDLMSLLLRRRSRR